MLGTWRFGVFAAATALALGTTAASADYFVFDRHNLVSNLHSEGANPADPVLRNAWGIAFGPGTAFWIADNATGCSTLYNGIGTKIPLQVKIPLPGNILPPADCTAANSQPAPNPAPAAPTGVVFNPTQGFAIPADSAPALFIFAAEDGTISAWNPGTGTAAALVVDRSKTPSAALGAVYKGLALGASFDTGCFQPNAAHPTTGICLFATNFRAGTVEVFDSNFGLVPMPEGAFYDPSLPPGYAPFGIANIDGDLFVTYALQNAEKHDDVSGPGHGFVDVFSTSGKLLTRFASRGALNSPWGITRATFGFGGLADHILIGNFGDGRINVYRPHGTFVGALPGPSGQPLTIDGLWSLTFGGASRAEPDTLYFTAGPNGETNGSFGEIVAVSR
ncbi:MAG: TIGR03118 family protein [Alphaproteobacteria bacterium]|nr:TIGR03118 family protein [Alphaproteobacteria bacterium]